MAGTQLCSEAWVAMAMIAGCCVFVCLGAIARALEVEARRQELHREVRRLLKQYAMLTGHAAGHAGRYGASGTVPLGTVPSAPSSMR